MPELARQKLKNLCQYTSVKSSERILLETEAESEWYSFKSFQAIPVGLKCETRWNLFNGKRGP